MLHIVHFSYVPNTASTNRLLAYLNNIPLNVATTVYFLLPDIHNSKLCIDKPNINVVHCWENIIPTSKLMRYLAFYFALWRIRRKIHKGDIVYCYNAPQYMKLFMKRGVKCFAEKTEHPEVSHPESRLISYDLHSHIKLCKNLSGLFVISTHLREYYIKAGIAQEKIHIINMIVDPARFKNIEKMSGDYRYVAYCGSATNNKDGVNKLIRSFSLVSKEIPNLYLYIIGQTPNSYEKDYQDNVNLAKELNVIDKIVFTGSVSSENVVRLLLNAEALLLNRPDSLQAQCGFPTKLGEYLLTSNPVVITDVGDVKIFLKDGYSAFIASHDNDEQFAEKILLALTDTELSKEVGRRGAEVAMKCFNAKIETAKMIMVMMDK